MLSQEIIHNEDFFTGSQGLQLYRQWWLPKGELNGVVVICHGIAEHSGRYAHVAEMLCGQGFAAGSFDLVNHGRSGDLSIFVDAFDTYLADMDIFMEQAQQKAAGKPVFMLGHSMGGTVTTLYVITRQPQNLKGFILSAPAVKIGSDISPFLIKVSGVISALAPHLKTIVLDNDTISKDPEVKRRYDADPLNYRGGVPARTGAELNRAIGRIQANFKAVTLPFLLMHGTADRLADINGSRMLYEQAASKDKTFKTYQGLFHEIMNEPEKDLVFEDILAWLKTHSVEK
ncbi:MAG: alpha/beta hydrolase [Anaerolineae bacterium]|nr:alpha/beta hydrolase [Anaerolineae bacterium]